MASSAVKKLPCITCGKAAGVFTCRGCLKDFCTRHATEHRHMLDQQMEEVTLCHDQLRQNFDEQTKEPRQHSLIQQIDEWEQNSIEKIRQVAENARKQLLNAISKHSIKMTEVLGDLTQKLTKARDDDDFVETDLKEWIDKLNKIKNDWTAPQTISIQQDVSEVSFIRKITINDWSNDCLEKSAGDIRIEENGLVIVHGPSQDHAAVRGRCQYSFGQHRFRFKIEKLDTTKWVFFGIKPKDAPMMSDSANTSTAYGWAGGNAVLLNGVVHSNYNGYISDMEMNDIIELIVDCDGKKLRLMNERTHSTHELNVDVTKCSLPWQLNLGLYYSNDRIRMTD
ncbi:unnamed protein product [Rotaria sp. Silwood2]|nr:unnamed protein product [Rotaria sp. Silwood2]CAF2945909.1 unnamed protein product [Rotaria sp. Silwood2]CAF3250634.1 unnamed protein product [Rotaria sp. Silwood2]CAF3349099.1 unnamed protein product [Rotaria sp. Silwood2]CAF4077820.1 unnamed protein product [Rotaria sp. Silwood2]